MEKKKSFLKHTEGGYLWIKTFIKKKKKHCTRFQFTFPETTDIPPYAKIMLHSLCHIVTFFSCLEAAVSSGLYRPFHHIKDVQKWYLLVDDLILYI